LTLVKLPAEPLPVVEVPELASGYVAGDIEIHPDARSVRVAGVAAALGSRAFDILLLLLAHRDRVVTKTELLDEVWRDVVVDENNLTVHVAALRKVLGAKAIATVAGRGYRFVLPIDEIAIEPARPVAPASSAAPAAVAPPQPPDRPSIAVMPFDNLSGDAQQDYVVDGITEDVITELARFRSMFVIARNSSFSYRGKAFDVRAVARELGVRYVLHGSFRRGAERVRVVAHLADAHSATQLWAEKYDCALRDIFSLQEELTQAIVAALAPQVEAGEFQRLRAVRTVDLTAYELAMRARDRARQADKTADPQARQEALQLAQQAVAIDPGCATAQTAIAFVQWQQIWAGSASSAAQAAADGLAAARAAIALDGADHHAHLWKGMLLIFTNEHAAGLADLRRAHELNPNDALTLSLLGQFLAVESEPTAGVAHARDALRLSPRDPMRWSFLNSLAWALFAAGDHVGAEAAARQSTAEVAQMPPAWLCLTLAQAALGHGAAAQQSCAQLQAMAPDLLAQRLAGQWPYAQPEFVRRATALLQTVAANLRS
jgi:TolB-like protein